MNSIWTIFQNKCLWSAWTAWFLAQLIKVPGRKKKPTLKEFFSSGGMPSSHSAAVSSLTVALGLNYGFDSPFFAIAAVFAVVVMYDAAGVRRETGRQGKALNEIIQQVLIEGQPITDDIMKELVGHTPLEVTVGCLFGILIAIVFFYLVH